MKPIPLFALALLLAACAPNEAPTPKPPTPNFVLIFIDDMGYGDIGPFGSTVNRTPNLDRMAAEGMKLTAFYAHPVCTPSRAALMTGVYPIRNGLQTGSWHPVLMPGDKHGIHADEITVAEVLKRANYATGMVGKWHLGDQEPFLPTNNGFDSYFGIPYSNDMSPFMPLNRPNHPPLPLVRGTNVIEEIPEDQSFLTRRYTEEALGFIEANHENPFFLYLPHSMVHVPLYAGDGFRGKSANGILGDAIEELDWSTGQILDKLRELNLAENTLVLFTSDNGPARGVAGPLRGKKGSTYEGGMREPTIAWQPGTVPAGTSYGETLSTMDVLPTFAALAGVELTHAVDGHNISSILHGESDAPSPYEALYYYRGYQLRAVRSGPWKLHTNGELYNLETDIGEQTDLAESNPDEVSRLEVLLAKAREELGDGPVSPLAEEPAIRLPPTARPIGLYDSPQVLIPRHGEDGEEATKPSRTPPNAPAFPPDYVRPDNW